MRLTVWLIALSVLMSAFVSGCATMRYPTAYKVEGKEVKEFKELDDERALKLIALIYNVKEEDKEDSIARSIALEKYLSLLGGRRSRYVKDSGIFDIKYDKVNISSWGEEDLLKLYDALTPRADAYYMDSAQKLTDIENARRIIYLTALNSIAREMKKRNNSRNVLMIAGQVLSTVLMVALSMI